MTAISSLRDLENALTNLRAAAMASGLTLSEVTTAFRDEALYGEVEQAVYGLRDRCLPHINGARAQVASK